MSKSITIAGAGLVGSLLGIMLAKRGYMVQIFERRADMRTESMLAGRSINLAMSDRGLMALEMAGLAEDIRKIAIPMRNRIMHDEHGGISKQPYGVDDQAINSVSRGDLNMMLMTMAEANGVTIHFNARCQSIDVDSATAVFGEEPNNLQTAQSDILIGADGAYSAVRDALLRTDRFDYSQSYLDHGYKELHIPPTPDGGFQLDKNALHIWPRHSFMMIALPNLDGSFTVTLFLAHKGPVSFEHLTTENAVTEFFATHFADAVPLMPTLLQDFFSNPESSLVTVKCSPWTRNSNIVLIGDAAHALVPFYGQGMNCGFEDCRVLIDCLDYTNDNWERALQLYEHHRKPDGDAIADLAVQNFIEMRDKVADKDFLRRKRIEGFMFKRYPTKFVPQYTLVTFMPNVPYSEAKRIAKEQDVLMARLMNNPIVYNEWESDAGIKIIDDEMETRKELVYLPISPSVY
ncbi:MAG: FAD-dependent monooxygenase [Ignavibacteria bacterium]|nr:FAD-dependent monooxygenase [Ignavibacteria bacterium]